MRFELEELATDAHNLYGLAFTLQAALEGPSNSECFAGAATVLATELMKYTERMQSLFARVEESNAA